jgi:iron(III) transport system substrate-binding protein
MGVAGVLSGVALMAACTTAPADRRLQSASGRPETVGAAGAGNLGPVNSEWEQTVAAARAEGKVVVAGPVGEAYRSVMREFEAKYPEISLEFTGMSGRDLGPRVLTERQAGQRLWDVHVGGTGTMYMTLKPAGVLAELRPTFLLPEVRDDASWHGGVDYGFADVEKKYVYAFLANFTAPVHVNRTSIPVRELSSPRQLIDPKFKGKIVMEDPRAQGAGSRQLASLMSGYGEDFVRTLLLDQEVVVTRNIRQLVEWVVRGRYPIGVGSITAGNLEEFIAQGLGKDIEHVQAPEVQVLAAGWGGLGVVDGAPHPNAAKVYINWLLSKRGQETWVDITNDNSRRKDVAPGDPSSFPDPTRLSEYQKNDESWEETRRRATELAESLIKS